MSLFGFTEKKKDFIITITPENDLYGETKIGITGYRTEVKKLVEDWLCDSTLDDFDRNKIVPISTSDDDASGAYKVDAVERKRDDIVDVELDEKGYLKK
jgi:hypothetical protein